MEKHWTQLSAGLTLSDESRERIRTQLASQSNQQEVISMKKKPLRLHRVWIAAALVAVLAMTALAVSPTLREALQNALGLFQPYSQDVEGVSVVDQGIEVKVVSALTDGLTIKLYYEIRDLTGDRLDEFTTDDLYLNPVNREELNWPVSGGRSEGVVQYDRDTKTALCSAWYEGRGIPAEELTLDFNIHSISPGQHHEAPTLDPSWIAEGTLKSDTLENGKSVLVPNQNPRSLGSDFLSLSSYGYGEDGVLHLLVKIEVDDDQFAWEQCHIDYYGGHSRSETAPDTPRSDRYAQRTNYKGMSEEEMERAAPGTRFQRDGTTYYDMRTGITPADVAEGDVEWYDYFSALLYTRPIIQGEWGLTVPVELLEQTIIDMTGSQTVLGGITAKTLHLSVMGCSVESDLNGNNGTLSYLLTVYLADGRVLSKIPSGGAMCLNEDDYAFNHWSFPEPVKPSEVTAIALGQWYVPIENGVALPGHWLDEQP